MQNKAWLTRLLAVTLVLPLAAACNKEDDTEANIEVETAPAPPVPITIQIMPPTGSTVAGEVVATHSQEQVNVRLTLNGLTDGDDYEARVRYGDCTVAAQYLMDEDAAEDAAEATQDRMNLEHKPGAKVADIDLTMTGTTATGTADVDSDELRANEAAYLVVTRDDALVVCTDLSGHDTGSMGGMGAVPPADSAHP